jgi:hypothetical protein
LYGTILFCPKNFVLPLAYIAILCGRKFKSTIFGGPSLNDIRLENWLLDLKAVIGALTLPRTYLAL